MREKDKIEKYLDKLIKKYKGTVSEAELTRYYFIKGRVIRVSDHIGRNSSGSISIIFDHGNSGNYIIHGHNSGNIAILNYNQVKEFVRTFGNMSFIFNEFTCAPSVTEISKDVSKNRMEIVTEYLTNNFTPNQLKQMQQWMNKRKKK